MLKNLIDTAREVTKKMIVTAHLMILMVLKFHRAGQFVNSMFSFLSQFNGCRHFYL